MFYFAGTRKPDFKNINQNIYDNYWKLHGFKMRDKLLERENIFLKWIKIKSSVLSIGCGNSRLLYVLNKKKNCKVKGYDINETVVETQRKNGIPSEKIDITKDSFKLDEKFDYIVISEVLEHLVIPEELIQKVKNNAQYLILSIPNSAFYRYRLGIMFRGRFFTQWAQHPAEHLRYWSHIDFLDWLNALGLDVEKTESSNGPFLKNIWPNIFGHQICYLVKSKN